MKQVDSNPVYREEWNRRGIRMVAVEAGRPYPVWIEKGLMAYAGDLIKVRKEPCKAAVISDITTDGLFGDRVEQSMWKSGFQVVRMSVPPGESSKNMMQLAAVLEFLAKSGLTRSDLVVALGGGVVGDLAGFAAAVYQRGVDYVQIPTTFLAAVDSSVGGKTAVDLDAGKNLAGAFHQPLAVICDCDAFRTLPDPVFADGMAEAIKYGVLAGEPLFGTLAAGKNGRQGLPQGLLPEVVEQCVKIKADIVSRDEFDRGERQLLNLGHTIGHAIERRSDYKIAHGHAVAMGMAGIVRATVFREEDAGDTADRILAALRIQGLPTKIPYEAEELYEISLKDKKKNAQGMQVIVPREIGRCEIQQLSPEQWMDWMTLAVGKETKCESE